MSNTTQTQVYICDAALHRLTKVTSLFPLDGHGDILRYTKELDSFGQATFRVSSYDNLLDSFGDILVPHKNWVQIVRGGTVIWQGAIIDNTKRTKDYIECVAAEPIWYLGKVLVNRTSLDPATGDMDGLYRIFNSGTMASAVTTIINETITTFQGSDAGHALANMTLGTVENPNYPPNMTDGSSPPKQLAGAWSFGDGISAPQLQFDFQPILYILKSFGTYAYADFYIDNSLVFNFVKFKGNNLTNKVTFNWNGPSSPASNVTDYNLPRLGQRMANSLYGVATDVNGNVLHYNQSDQPSITTYGVIEGVAAYTDVKDQATLNARIQAEIPLISAPDNSPVSVVLNEKGYPLGQYDVGDIVNINIQNRSIDFTDSRRVVGYSVSVHNTGREITTVQTNKVLPFQFQSLGSLA